MQLLATTTILWAAGTALAHRDRENGKSTRERHKDDNDFRVPGNNVLQSTGSAVECRFGTITEGTNHIFQLGSGRQTVDFTCHWKRSNLAGVEDVRIRRYGPTPTLMAMKAPAASTVNPVSQPSEQVPGSGGAPTAAGGGGLPFPTSVASMALSAINPNPGTTTGRPTIIPHRRQSLPPIIENRVGSQDMNFRVDNPNSLISDKEAMYLEVVWNLVNGDGSISTYTSYSHLFGVVTNPGVSQALISAVPSPGIGNSYQREVLRIDQPGNVVDQASAPKVDSNNKSTPPSLDGNDSGGGKDDKDGSDSGSNGQSSSNVPVPGVGIPGPNNGLSQGAIAGIAVGAVVGGLLLIGALVFFLLRRRRRQQGDHVSNARPYARDQHTATADLMGEKEAAAGGMGETPHSPYSDDGHGSLPRGMAAPGAAAAMAAGAGAHHGSPSAPAPADMHRSSFTPYSDDGTAVPPVDRATGARSETPGGGRYEHLMEQGMSAEDRARVEEEERQLDAEIERARK